MNIDPIKFTEADMPVIIIEEDRQGLLGGLIKWKSAGNYNHVEAMIRPGIVISQGPAGLKEIPIKDQLHPRIKMKFWKFCPQDPAEKIYFFEAIKKDLQKPWYRKRYDFLGILGQAIGIRWLQIPWRRYCSEIVAAWFRSIGRNSIPARPTPAELNEIFKKMPDMQVMGYWEDPDAD